MSKFLIGIGDSFTQGQGSITPDIYKKYGDDVFNGLHRLPIDKDERRCSWVGQICNRYLKDYEPINLGQRGRGNRSAAKELYLNDLDSTSEKIVVYCFSGMERFDFSQKDDAFATHHFYAMFPNPNEKSQPLWKAYAEHVWSDQFVVVETILNIIEVQNWCKVNNAKLLMVSAFDCNFYRKYFIDNLPMTKKHFADLVDWDLFWYPDGYDSWLHMCIDMQESGSPEVEDLKWGGYWQKYGGVYPCKEYITPCCHPTNLSHKIFARKMAEELRNRNYV